MPKLSYKILILGAGSGGISVAAKLKKSFKDDEIALLFGNNHSSAETDIQFSNSYKDGNSASPALFVYTLPNILIGEIAIRNKWYGENLFTVYPKFNAELFEKNITLLAETHLCCKYANDVCWKILQKTDKWVCTKTRIGKQRAGYSDNSRKYVDYNC